MILTRKTMYAAVAALLVAAVVFQLSVPADAGHGNSTMIGSGPDFVYSGGAMLAGSTITVSAGVPGGNSQITLEVDGVDAPAGTEFGAHVHVNPCGPTGGAAGGHFMADGAQGSLQHREVWLDFIVDAHGRGRATATRNFTIPDRANRSIILHIMGTDHETGAAGARLACIDLDG